MNRSKESISNIVSEARETNRTIVRCLQALSLGKRLGVRNAAQRNKMLALIKTAKEFRSMSLAHARLLKGNQP